MATSRFCGGFKLSQTTGEVLLAFNRKFLHSFESQVEKVVERRGTISTSLTSREDKLSRHKVTPLRALKLQNAISPERDSTVKPWNLPASVQYSVTETN